MVRIRLIFLLFIAYSSLYSQEYAGDSSRSAIHNLKFEGGVLISAKDKLPFWMKSNNSNRFTAESANSHYQILDYRGSYPVIEGFNLNWEFESILNIRERVNGKFIQANFGFETNFLRFRMGYDEEFFGLSDTTLSIGNLVYGNNARPIPKVLVSTNGWQKSPVLGKNLSFQAYLAHGWFEQNRFQSEAMLHQKYLYLRAKLFQNKLTLIGGLNHNAQWGGSNSQNESTQPTGLKNYARIFLGSSGGSDALSTDQRNALGNHLGSYDLRGSFEFKSFVLTNYWQFLWEDKSGLTPFNWRDGLIGASIHFKNSRLIKKVLLEVVRTNNQNAQKVADDGTTIFEPDNFFNNSVYRTGWSYHNQVIGNPIFLLLNEGSTSSSRIKNSINAVNIGISGSIRKLNYQVNYIDFQNKGTKFEVIDPSLRLRAVNVALNYQLSSYASFGSTLNYQEANFGSQRNFGLRLQYTKSLTF
ncbi:hypothetical protein BFP97_13485 [Roseivirga sp. 4D4]|uniref:capsule assembly Wzi family protein n=1 Tax=Roseivirga sp. 4D4 TaxID=1889784 RepID=UPI0008535783|nr:capsule assembly Wzi family protein [Roseivirga sp. 4D4]OEK02471.1 hypothetical protein BFP97_13485 [Roseivirga sp. 4D4]